MIVVFGSLNLDLVFRVASLPRAGETVLTASVDRVPGGKGANQALAARRAAPSLPVAFVGAAGRDEWAGAATALLAADGVDLGRLDRIDAATGCAAVLVDSRGENAIVVASGANRHARAAAVPDSLLGPASTVVLQMEVPAAENRAVIARSRARGARIVLNVAPAAPVDAMTLDAVDVLCVNEGEARAVSIGLGLAPDTPSDLARELATRHHLACIVTLGGRGCLAATPEASWTLPAFPVRPVDTTGAGDAFVGTLAAGLATGASLPAALRRAGVAGALACTVPGAQTSLPYAAAIDAILAEAPEPLRTN
ncbi:MAG: ribokinase [Alphaproteobacteria bacterium]